MTEEINTNPIAQKKAGKKKRNNYYRDRTALFAEFKMPHEYENNYACDLLLERMAAKLIEWAKDPSVLIVTEFYTFRGITPQRWSDWCKRNKTLGDAYIIAKEIIGLRREVGAIVGDFKEATIHKSQAQYSHIWHDQQEKEKQNQAGSGTIIVQMDSIPSVSSVPLLENNK